MVKIASCLAIAVMCLAITCQAMIDWPTRVYNSSNPSGYLKTFQISTDRPKDNQTFTVKAVYYLTRAVSDWQGLSDANLFAVFNGTQAKRTALQLKKLRQFASDAGSYGAGSNITLGFNYTYNSSQNATIGEVLVRLGDKDKWSNQYIDLLFDMPKSGQNDQQNTEFQISNNKTQKVSWFEFFLNKLKNAFSKNDLFG